MSLSLRASSAPGSSRPDPDPDRELPFQVLAESRKTQPSDVHNQGIPDELLVSLTSTICNRNSLAHNAHHRHCKGCGFRRPDAVWHHPLGRKKYKYFLEQPPSLTGAGRDISFLCDASTTQRKTFLPPLTDRISNEFDNNRSSSVLQNLSVSDSLVPEEYHIVKNKGLQSLEFYEDAFTVQLKDDEQRLRVFPSLRPSGRQEVMQLMRMMDDMLEKAGVEQQMEELNELSQMEGLLDLVRAEQNIYNIVFHEVIRQVSVGCVERGQLLAKLRQRYQSLLERIPHRLKALHTEVVAQRALDRQLTTEIHRIKTSMQQLSVELSRIREHDAFVSQQAERAHQQLEEALSHTHNNSDVVQGYHELYELQRSRLEAQLLQMTEDRDCWSQLTYSLALKVISVKKLHLVSQLHASEQTWYKAAEHCSMYLGSKDTEDLKDLVGLKDMWKEELTAFMSRMKKTDYAHCEQISAIHQGVAKWPAICTTYKKSPDPEYARAAVEEIHADLKQWVQVLALQTERYQGEELLCCQQTLGKLSVIQEKWLKISGQLLRRHSTSNSAPSGHAHTLSKLDSVMSELQKKLNNHVNGENGIHSHIMALVGLVDSWITNLTDMIKNKQTMPVLDWTKLEKTLGKWHSLAEDALQKISALQIGRKKDTNKPDLFTETEQVLDKVQEFVTSLSSFIDSENHTLREEITSIHVAQTHWMLNLLLLMVPDYDEDQDPGPLNRYNTGISAQQLEEDAKVLSDKLDFYTKYFTSSCQLIVEEQIVKSPLQVTAENEMHECRKLQTECMEWVETSIILLSGVKDGPVHLSVRTPDPTPRTNAPVSPSDHTETLVNEEITAEDDGVDETEAEQKENPEVTHEPENICQGELMDHDSPTVEIIDSDGTIVQKKLGESKVRLTGTADMVLTPVTAESQKALADLGSVGLLQQQLHDSEVQLQNAEQRALKAQEDLQEALEKIQDLERQLQGRPSLEAHQEPQVVKNDKTPEPPPPPVTKPSPPKKTPEAKPTSSHKRTKKR
ncbi:axonemal dynein light chain domain-containing protein 1 [Sphaeramia orbicularis]|uniref:axonemal dynein light chain domain-containing protein 1 n=1 Tax=Sphaeramia orbicularis TaxID=375764 RepID=UPI00117F3923|nr:axonemal dynein light chain domain-containing protein 1 [Sphaeramia orbicularis]